MLLRTANGAVLPVLQVLDLGDIFGKCNVPRKYHKRTSSGVWQNDRLTSPEEAAYKRQFFGR